MPRRPPPVTATMAMTSGIPFTKEQQWKIDFATVEAVKGTARPSVAATATIKAQPDGEALLAAPAAGVLRPANSFPRVGQAVQEGAGAGLSGAAPRRRNRPGHAGSRAGKARSGSSRRGANASAWKRCSRTRPSPRSACSKPAPTSAWPRPKARRPGAARTAQLGGSGRHRHPLAHRWHVADVAVAPGAFVNEGAPLFHVANTGAALAGSARAGKRDRPAGQTRAAPRSRRWLSPSPSSSSRARTAS
jgi:cobalt-zinc-cadmium efflux system membrane fusion protein